MTQEPLNPAESALLAASLDLASGDLTFVSNGLLTKVHPADRCAGEHCWVHRPTPGWTLAGAPVYWSQARRLAYRQCTHGVLHPDVDAVAYANRFRTNYVGRQPRKSDAEWHPECDGCCHMVDE